MNKKDYLAERGVFNLIRFSNRSGSQINNFRSYMSETENHINNKFKVWLLLRKLGINCYTEAIIKGGRIDILAFKDGGIAIEILETETKEECLKKLKKYLPDEIEIILIKDEKDIEELKKCLKC